MSGPRHSRIPQAAATDKRLTDLDRRIIMLLGRHTDAEGWCFRSQGRMAVELDVEQRSVRRSLKRLEALGYIDIEAGKRRDGGNAVCHYLVHIVPVVRMGQLSLFEAPITPCKRKSGAQPEPTPRTPPVLYPPGPGESSPPDWQGPGQEERPLENDSCAAEDARALVSEFPFSEPVPIRTESAGAALPSDATGAVPSVPASEAGAVPISQTDLDTLARRLRDAAGTAINAAHPAFINLAEPIGWIVAGCDLDADILPTIAGIAARARASPVKSWSYFAGAITSARDRRRASAQPTPSTNIVPFGPRGARHVETDSHPRRRSRADDIEDAFIRRMGLSDAD